MAAKKVAVLAISTSSLTVRDKLRISNEVLQIKVDDVSILQQLEFLVIFPPPTPAGGG